MIGRGRSLKSYLEANGIELSIVDGPDYQLEEYTDPFGHPQSIPRHHYVLCFTHEDLGTEMEFPYFCGAMTAGDDPESIPDQIFDMLISEAMTAENCPRFEDYCAELGEDTDSRKAHETWSALHDQRVKLVEFLGDDPDELIKLATKFERL